MGKVSVATTWLQSCSGCHISFLDLHEELLDVLDLIEIKTCPPLIDVKEPPKVTVALVEGAVANEDNVEVLKKFREQSDILVALGSCACYGGIPGLRNIFYKNDVLARAYIDTESTVEGKIPSDPEIPELLEYVKPLDQVVKVDYIIPGCPPLPSMIKDTVVALVEGREPTIPSRNLCEECPRYHKDMIVPKLEFLTDTVTPVCELEHIDPDRCFLEQGVACAGLATHEGCDARCIKGNMPCRGCMGPTPGALEQGAKLINALGSLLPAGALMLLDDIVGMSYRFSVPVSIYPHLAGIKEKEVG